MKCPEWIVWVWYNFLLSLHNILLRLHLRDRTIWHKIETETAKINGKRMYKKLGWQKEKERGADGEM